MTPGLNRPRPNITADLTWGSPLRTPSGYHVSIKMETVVRGHYPMGPDLSGLEWYEEIPGSVSEKSGDEGGAAAETNLLPRVVHELVVRATDYLPVTREGWMRDDEVTCRVAVPISYFSIVDADSISRRGLGIYRSTIHIGCNRKWSVIIPRPPIRRRHIRRG